MFASQVRELKIFLDAAIGHGGGGGKIRGGLGNENAHIELLNTFFLFVVFSETCGRDNLNVKNIKSLKDKGKSKMSPRPIYGFGHGGVGSLPCLSASGGKVFSFFMDFASRPSLDSVNQDYIDRKERWARKMGGKEPKQKTANKRLPPGQREVQNFPVLDLGLRPQVSWQEWRPHIHGQVENPVNWVGRIL